MSALTLRLPKIGHYPSRHNKKAAGEEAHTISNRLGQIAWFTVAFLLSCAAGPFAALGVIGAVFSLSRLESEEPMPKEA